MKRYVEILLIFSVVFYWVSTANILNPIAISLMAILLYQLWSQNKTTGMILGSIYLLLNLYLILALMSEFSEFPSGDIEGLKMLLIGMSFIGVNIFLSICLLRKSVVRSIRVVE